MDRNLEDLQKVLLKLKEKGEVSLAYLSGWLNIITVKNKLPDIMEFAKQIKDRYGR